ncbi:MAG: hypothetical protein WCD12_21925 [Candidatus Binatus sp.]|jgi:hypothetical protein|uniref:hypothetical protein n=1 Tax=Candidatus Binatus sp. TaxID=2811406 RepID=UPI003C779C56
MARKDDARLQASSPGCREDDGRIPFHCRGLLNSGKPPVMKPRHAAALALVGWLAGCGISTKTADGNLNQIKSGMAREEVIAKLGTPPMGAMVRGVLHNDDYDCDPHGQIMLLHPGAEFTYLPFAMWFDKKELDYLHEQSRECVVNYDKTERVVSTEQGDKPALLFAK